METERESFGREIAREAPLQGGNHPEDVPGIIFMFRWFADTPWFREALRFEVVAGDCVLLRVADGEEGIAVEHLARVFEPFFTTKGVALGRGWG